MSSDAVVTAAPERNRYEIRVDGELIGVADYADREADGDRVFTHTEISPSVEGKGYGHTLVRFALADTREQGRGIVPICSFVRRVVDEDNAA